jgi:hypothetical protein
MLLFLHFKEIFFQKTLQLQYQIFAFSFNVRRIIFFKISKNKKFIFFRKHILSFNFSNKGAFGYYES